MKKHPPRNNGELRRQAEEQARNMEPTSLSAQTPEEIQRVLHELRVHQIQLEMQNKELRTAQAEIEAGRARYYDLYDLAPVGYCTLSEKGLILEANLTAATLLGTTRGTLVNQPISRFIFKNDQDIYYLHRKKLFETSETQECELRLVKSDGTFIWAHLTAIAARAEDGAPLCRVVLTDITDRKQAEEALRENEALLARSQEIAHTGSWKLDLTTNHLTWSDEVYRIFGCKPQEVPPTYEAFLDFVHPADRAAVDEAYSRSVREGSGGYDIEHRIVRRNSNEVRHVHERCVHERDAAGAIIQSTGMVQDITERVEAQEIIAVSEEKYRRAFMTSPDSININRMSDGQYIEINEGFLHIMGYKRKEVIGRTSAELNIWKNPEDRKRLVNGLQTDGYVENLSAQFYRADGTIREGLMSACVIELNGEQCILSITRDITARKRAEEELSKSEENLRITLNSIGDAVVSTDVAGRVVSMNPVAEALTGWNENEAAGQPIEDIFNIINEQTRQTVESPVDNVLKTGLVVGLANHTLLIAKDGREIPIADSGAPIKNSDGETTGVVLVFRDQTDERAARRALQQSQQRLESMFRAAPVGIGLVRDRVIIEANERLYPMTGYSVEEMIDQNARMLYPSQKEYEQVGVELYGQIQKNGIGSVETIWQRKDGTRINVLLSSASLDPEDPLKWVTLAALDITDRKRAEEELRKSKNELERTLEATTDGIWTWNFKTDTLCFSPKYYKLLGYEPNEFPANFENWLNLIHPDDREQALAYAEEYLKTKPDEYENEFRIRTKSNGYRWMHADARVVERDENGEAVYMIGNQQDITERKTLESQLLQAQKMESIGRLAGGVAHDLNNMLTIILGQTQLLEMKLAADDPNRQEVTAIQEAGQRSANLTRQLLAFARKETIAPVPLGLNDAVEDMLKMLRRLIGEDIALSWQPDHDLWQVKMDPSQLDQILANLCVNARDAIGGVGKVTIETEYRTIDKDYCRGHAEARPGDFVVLAVSDDGDGMDDETLAQIFEPFFTTKPTGEGTGLGLATVYGIIKQNGGFVNVYSEPGEGTTFRIYLPRLVVEEKARGDRRQAPNEACPRGDETVLLAEDEPAVREIARTFLETLGYRVLEADCPAAALDLAAAHPEPIQLLLTDVVMPGMSGRELAERLAADLPDLRVLYMSGYTADSITHRGVLGQDLQFIGKPFTQEELARKVRQILDA